MKPAAFPALALLGGCAATLALSKRLGALPDVVDATPNWWRADFFRK